VNEVSKGVIFNYSAAGEGKHGNKMQSYRKARLRGTEGDYWGCLGDWALSLQEIQR